jgi:hypothetical protein
MRRDPAGQRCGRAARLLAVVAFLPSICAAGERPSHLAFYAAQYTPQRLVDILTERPKSGSSHLAALAWSRSLSDADRSLRWEVEGQLVQHTGQQSHQEINVAIVARWMRFPWDHWLDTRVAFGEGLSYATRVPPIEPRAARPDETSVRLLNHLLLEIEVALPQRERWSVFTRIHHRSGVAGIFGNVRGGSNFIGLGARYRY